MAISEEVTRLLFEWKNGNQAAVDALTPLIYQELRRLAAGYLFSERAAATLQPTALVHEAFIRLVSQDIPDWQNRAHFFGVAAHLMRQILVDHARKQKSAKRGGGIPKMPLDEAIVSGLERGADMIALDYALTALTKISQRQCKIIELRFFGGLNVEEVAQALQISPATIGREQRLAEAWLHREMSRDCAT